MPARKHPRISAEDLYRIKLASDCEISPDGRHVVFCEQRIERRTQKKYSSLWLAGSDGSHRRQFTFGNQTDLRPRWSPDGRQIAFFSNRKVEQQPQIYLIPLDGGEARPLTDLKGTFGNIEWSPDGRSLVCGFRKRDADEVRRDQDEDKKKLGIVSRHITRVLYKLDGAGFLPAQRWHIWTIQVGSGRTRQLTDSDTHDEVEPRWTPDGRHIVYLSNRGTDPDFSPEDDDLFAMPASGGRSRKISTAIDGQTRGKGLLSISPDGKWVAYVGRRDRGISWQNEHLWVVPFRGGGAPRNLTSDGDFSVGNVSINDMVEMSAGVPAWSSDSQALLFQVTRHGNTELRSVSLASGKIRSVIEDDGVVGRFSLDAAGERLAYCYSTSSDIAQIRVRQLAGGEDRQITRLNRSMVDASQSSALEQVWFKGAAGNQLQGWILKPPGFDPKRKYPSILQIHGGPLAQYGNLFMHEFHYLAAQGYVVYYCNPRGGRGYGEEHARAIWNDWGSADYADLMAWADIVQRKRYIDAKRMGVTGGSYGGYMTNWIIGHTTRFNAAVTQRCVSNLVDFYGSTDFNWRWEYAFGGTPPWEDLDNYWRQSPMKYIGNVRTPTLVIHSEGDLRCPIEQGEQVYVALKRLGVDTEMIRFPEESHGLSRGGRTDRRIERLKHILRWFDRYLKSNSQ